MTPKVKLAELFVLLISIGWISGDLFYESNAGPYNGWFTCSDCTNINGTKLCDFNMDCFMGDDEWYCPYSECNETTFKCIDALCIPKSWACDGKTDCLYGEDEWLDCGNNVTYLTVNDWVCPTIWEEQVLSTSAYDCGFYEWHMSLEMCKIICEMTFCGAIEWDPYTSECWTFYYGDQHNTTYHPNRNRYIAYPQCAIAELPNGETQDSILSKDAIEVTAKGEQIAELDIVIPIFEEETDGNSRKKRKALRNEQTRWPNKVVPYEIADTFADSDAEIIMAAINHWQLYTCLTFRPLETGDEKSVYFKNDENGCWSYVGAVYYQQGLNLGNWCVNEGIIIHELGHVAGVMHEQSRPDRDLYVTILEENIQAATLFNFDKYDTTYIDTFNLPYDYLSVMHYGQYAFTMNGEITIETADPDAQSVIGRSAVLSYYDILIANLMYGCNDHCPSNIRCPDDGFLFKDCTCVCLGTPLKPCDPITEETTQAPAVTTQAPAPAPTTQAPNPTTQAPNPTTQAPNPATQAPVTTAYVDVCAEGEFTCGNCTCIAADLRCNTWYDCEYGEDEWHCNNGGNSADCTPESYKCQGSDKCIDSIQLCDGWWDCLYGEDEWSGGCTLMEFREIYGLCDSIWTEYQFTTSAEYCGYDYGDFADLETCQAICEINWCTAVDWDPNTNECWLYFDGCIFYDFPVPLTVHPSRNHYRRQYVCEETTTAPTTTAPEGCRSDEYTCGDCTCIIDYWECDGWRDCSLGEDEWACQHNYPACNEGDFKCSNGRCIPSYWECDDWWDCLYGEDEWLANCDNSVSYRDYFGIECPTLWSEFTATTSNESCGYYAGSHVLDLCKAMCDIHGCSSLDWDIVTEDCWFYFNNDFCYSELESYLNYHESRIHFIKHSICGYESGENNNP